MASIICGNCKQSHASVEEVRACYNNTSSWDHNRYQDSNEDVPPVVEPATPGMYVMDGEIYKVQIAVHGSGMPYAKQLVQGSFEYAPGVVKRLNQSHRMTLEQAKEYGALYGTCCVCGRTLTNEVSIEAGIGPVCSGRL